MIETDLSMKLTKWKLDTVENDILSVRYENTDPREQYSNSSVVKPYIISRPKNLSHQVVSVISDCDRGIAQCYI